MNRVILTRVIIVVSLIVIACLYFAWRGNLFSIPGEPTDYFTCVEKGGRIFSDGRTSLSYCSFGGKIYSYDG
jgi:hypothetical protein